MMQVISLGAGVQSTTMALMAAHGEITPMPDCAIFADTGWEPAPVYEHLAWLMSGKVLPFPVHVVKAGNLRDDLISRSSTRCGDSRFVTIPAYLKDGDRAGIGRRQCTTHYKIEPIFKKMRALLGKRPRERIAPGSVVQWVGISVDEVFRATPSKVRWQIKRFPLLEARMNRLDYFAWLERNGYPRAPKSACIGCPFHNNDQWRDLRDNRPEEWADAVIVDSSIRWADRCYGVPAKRAQQFLHPQRVPLQEVDLTTLEDHGQLNMFNNECEGMCGV